MNRRKQLQDEAQPEIPCEKLKNYLQDMGKHISNLNVMQAKRQLLCEQVLLGKRTAEEREIADINRKYA